MPPIRVAQVVGKMVGGGMETVVMNYYRHIDRGKVQFDFVVDSDSTRVPSDEIYSLGGRVFVVPPYQQQPANSRELERLFRRESWPIVHSHMNSLSAFSLRAAKRAGVLIRIAHSHSTWGKGEHMRNLLKALLRTQANRYPTHRMACTQHAGEWLFGKSADFRVLPNAFEAERFVFSEVSRVRIRSEIGAGEKTLVIGHIGRFSPQKNQGHLVRAFAKIACRKHDALLLFVGEGYQQNSVKELVADLGLLDRVIFLGQRDDVADIYSAMDVFCLPSTYEGFGNVVVEAQRSGLPCIVSDSIPEDAMLTDRVLRIPVAAGADEWAKRILEIRRTTPRELDGTELVSFERYDITKTAPSLTEYYLAVLSIAGVDSAESFERFL